MSGVTRSVLAGTIAATLGCLVSSANADTLVYNDTTTAGNSNYPYVVSNNFTVNQAVSVTGLAVFDSTKGTISTDLNVGLYNDTTNSVVISPVDFNGTAYNGVGGSYFVTKAVTPLTLISGDTYSVEAYGFNNTFLYVDSSGPSAITFNGSPALTSASVGGSDELNQAGGPLCNMTTGANCTPSSGTGTGNFQSRAGEFFGAGSLQIATPIPAALPLFASGLGVIGLLARRKKRKTVVV